MSFIANQKIQRRTVALRYMQWTEEQKRAMARVLTQEYTSSDESDMSEDEEGQQFVKAYLIKKLPWERTALRNAKTELDRAHLYMNPRGRCMRFGRKVHPEPSTRPLPFDMLDWAVRQPGGLSQSDFLTPLSSTSSLQGSQTHADISRRFINVGGVGGGGWGVGGALNQ